MDTVLRGVFGHAPVATAAKDGSSPEAGVEIEGLIQRAKSYDDAAFADLYRLAVRPVYRYLSVRVNSQEEAEELTQEVFLAALQGMQGLRARDETGLFAWLFQIARNKLADHLRRRYQRPSVALEEASLVQSGMPLPDEVAERGEEDTQLRQALQRLTPEQREVITYKYVLGYDNQRTGRLVGRKPNAVNQLHHRALASLHRLLLENGMTP